MDTLIRLRPEELTENFFLQLKSIAASANRIEIKIDGTDAVNNLSEKEITNRLQQLENRQTVSFTMEELETYINKATD